MPYERTYKGLPVVGGDFVLATDSAGNLKYASVAQQRPIGALTTTPALTPAAAAKTARAQLRTVNAVESTTLVVYTLGAAPARSCASRSTWSAAPAPARGTGPARSRSTPPSRAPRTP
ncbi:hypothetical protein [Micromonospora tulbaghiae]